MRQIALALVFLASLVSAQTTTWNGSVDSDWFNAANWSAGVPDAATDAVIPAGVTPPVVGAAASCLGLDLQAGASASGTATLEVFGDLVLDGAFAGPLTLAGAQAAVVNGSAAQPAIDFRVEKTGGAGVTFQVSLQLQNAVFTSSVQVNGAILTCANLSIAGGAPVFLGTAGSKLRCTNTLNVDGLVNGTGCVETSGPVPVTGSGQMNCFQVGGPSPSSASLSASMTVVDLRITNNGALTITPPSFTAGPGDSGNPSNAVTVQGNLDTQGPVNGAVRMGGGSSGAQWDSSATQANLDLFIQKTVTANNAVTMDELDVGSSGILVLIQSRVTTNDTVVAPGGAITSLTGLIEIAVRGLAVIAGDVQATLVLQNNANLSGGGDIQRLKVDGAGGNVSNLQSDVDVDDVEVEAGGTLQVTQGATLNAGGDVNGQGPINGNVRMNGSQSGSLTGAGVSFEGVQLDIAKTGGASVNVAVPGSLTRFGDVSLVTGNFELNTDIKVENMIVAAGASVTGSGRLTVESGTLQLNGSVDQLDLLDAVSVTGSGSAQDLRIRNIPGPGGTNPSILNGDITTNLLSLAPVAPTAAGRLSIGLGRTLSVTGDCLIGGGSEVVGAGKVSFTGGTATNLTVTSGSASLQDVEVQKSGGAQLSLALSSSVTISELRIQSGIVDLSTALAVPSELAVAQGAVLQGAGQVTVRDEVTCDGTISDLPVTTEPLNNASCTLSGTGTFGPLTIGGLGSTTVSGSPTVGTATGTNLTVSSNAHLMIGNGAHLTLGLGNASILGQASGDLRLASPGVSQISTSASATVDQLKLRIQGPAGAVVQILMLGAQIAELVVQSGSAQLDQDLDVEGTVDIASGAAVTGQSLDIRGSLQCAGTLNTVSAVTLGSGAASPASLNGEGGPNQSGTIGSLRLVAGTGGGIINVTGSTTCGQLEVEGGATVNISSSKTLLVNNGSVTLDGTVSGNLDIVTSSPQALGGTADLSGLKIRHASTGGSLLIGSGFATDAAGNVVIPDLTLEGGTTTLSAATVIGDLELRLSAQLSSSAALTLENEAAIDGFVIASQVFLSPGLRIDDGGSTFPGTIQAPVRLTGNSSGAPVTVATSVRFNSLEVPAGRTLEVQALNGVILSGDLVHDGIITGLIAYQAQNGNITGTGSLTNMALRASSGSTVSLAASFANQTMEFLNLEDGHLQLGGDLEVGGLTCQSAFTITSQDKVLRVTSSCSVSFGQVIGTTLEVETGVVVFGDGRLSFLRIVQGGSSNPAELAGGLQIKDCLVASGALRSDSIGETPRVEGVLRVEAGAALEGPLRMTGDLSASAVLNGTATALELECAKTGMINVQIEGVAPVSLAKLEVSSGVVDLAQDVSTAELTLAQNTTLQGTGSLTLTGTADVQGTIDVEVNAAPGASLDQAVTLPSLTTVAGTGGATGNVSITEDVTVEGAVTIATQTGITVANGKTLSFQENLVVQGTAEGRFAFTGTMPGAVTQATPQPMMDLTQSGTAALSVNGGARVRALRVESNTLAINGNNIEADTAVVTGGSTLLLEGLPANLTAGPGDLGGVPAGDLIVKQSLNAPGAIDGGGFVVAADSSNVSSSGPFPNLRTTGSAVTVGANNEVENTLIIDLNSVLTIPSSSELRVCGNFVMNGTYNGKIVLKGSEDTVLIGDGQGDDLCVDKDDATDEVNAMGNLDFNGDFDLLNGTLDLNSGSNLNSNNSSSNDGTTVNGPGNMNAGNNLNVGGNVLSGANVNGKHVNIQGSAQFRNSTTVGADAGGSIQSGTPIQRLRVRSGSGGSSSLIEDAGASGPLPPVVVLSDLQVETEFIADPGTTLDLSGHQLTIRGGQNHQGRIEGGLTRIVDALGEPTRFIDGSYEDLTVELAFGPYNVTAGSQIVVEDELRCVQGVFSLAAPGITLSARQVMVEGTGNLRSDTRTDIVDDLIVNGGALIVRGDTDVGGDFDLSGGNAQAFDDFDVAGDVTVSGGVLDLRAQLALIGELSVSGGDAAIRGPEGSIACDRLSHSGGVLRGDGSGLFPRALITVEGPATIDGEARAVDLVAKQSLVTGPSATFTEAPFNPFSLTLIRLESATLEQQGSAELGLLTVGPGISQFLSSVAIADELEVEAGGTLDGGGFALGTRDDLRVDGTATNVALQFNGTDLQTLRGLGSYPGFVVAKPGEVRLDDDLQIAGELGLATGTLRVQPGHVVTCASLGTTGGIFTGTGQVDSQGAASLADTAISDLTLAIDGACTVTGSTTFSGDQHCLLGGPTLLNTAAPFRRLSFDRSGSPTALQSDVEAQLDLAVATPTTVDLQGRLLSAVDDLDVAGAVVGGPLRSTGSGLSHLTGGGTIERLRVVRDDDNQRLLIQAAPTLAHLELLSGRCELANNVDLTVTTSSVFTGGIFAAPNSQFVPEATVTLDGASALLDGTAFPAQRLRLQIDAAQVTLGAGFAPGLTVVTAFGGAAAQVVATSGAVLFDAEMVNGISTTVNGRLGVSRDLTVSGTLIAPDGFDVSRDFIGLPSGVIDHGPATSVLGRNVTTASAHQGPGAVYECTGNGTIHVTGPDPLAILITNGNHTAPDGQTWASLDLQGGSLDVPVQGFNQSVTLTIAGNATLSGGSLSGPGPGRLIVAGDLQQGAPVSGLGLRVGGVFTQTSGDALPTLELGGAGLVASTEPVSFGATGGTLRANRLFVNDRREPQAGLTLDGREFTVAAGGELLLRNRSASLDHNGGVPFLRVFGELSVDAGSSLGLDDRTLTVEPGGRLSLIGAVGNPAALAPTNGGDWQLLVRGELAARQFDLSGFGSPGVILDPGSSFAAAPDDVRRGRLHSPVNANGSFLRILRTDALDLRDLRLDHPAGTGTNVDAPVAGGSIRMINARGDFAGPAFENDPQNRVDWIDETTVVAAFTVTGQDDSALVDWTTTAESDLEAFVLERGPTALGPFVPFAERVPLGPTSYQLLDAPAPVGTFFWRLSERLPGGLMNELATAQATVTTRLPANVLTVGPGGFADVAAALAAASGPEAIIRVLPGTYPPFQVVAPTANVNIFAAAPGVVIDGAVLLQNIAAGTTVRLAGLVLDASAVSLPALSVNQSAGLVFLDEITALCDPATSAVSLLQVDHLFAHRCDLAAGVEGILAQQCTEVVVTRGVLNALTAIASTISLVEVTPTINADGASAVTSLSGIMPDLSAPDFILPGDPWILELSTAPGAPWFLALALGNQSLAFPGTQLPVLLDVATTTVLANGVADAQGEAAVIVPIPVAAGALAGFVFHAQGGAFAPSAGMIRFTNADLSIMAQ